MSQRRGRAKCMLSAIACAFIVGGLLMWWTRPRPLFQIHVDSRGKHPYGFYSQNFNGSLINACPPNPNEAAPHWNRWIVFHSGTDYRISFYDPRTRERVDTELVGRGGFDRDGFFVTQYGPLKRFHPATKSLLTIPQIDCDGNDVLSSDLRTALIRNDDTFEVIDVETGRIRRVLPIDNQDTTISPNGELVAYVQEAELPQDEFIEVIRISDGKSVCRIAQPAKEILGDYQDDFWKFGTDVTFNGTCDGFTNWMWHQVPNSTFYQSAAVVYSLSERKYVTQLDLRTHIKSERFSPHKVIDMSQDGDHALWNFNPDPDSENGKSRYCVTLANKRLDDDPIGLDCLILDSQPDTGFVPGSTTFVVASADFYTSRIGIFIERKLFGYSNYRVMLYDWQRDSSVELYSHRFTEKTKSQVLKDVYCQPDYISLLFTDDDHTWIEVWSSKPWRWRYVSILTLSVLILVGVYRRLRRQPGLRQNGEAPAIAS